MKYQEMLDLCKQNNAFGSQFYIAEEMQCQIEDVQEIECDEQRFEDLCSLAHALYLKAEGISILRICKAVARVENEYVQGTGNNPLYMDKWELIGEAGWEED